jgi:hypothetical protein
VIVLSDPFVGDFALDFDLVRAAHDIFDERLLEYRPDVFSVAGSHGLYLQRLTFHPVDGHKASCGDFLDRGSSGIAIYLTFDVGELPGHKCTPPHQCLGRRFGREDSHCL